LLEDWKLVFYFTPSIIQYSQIACLSISLGLSICKVFIVVRKGKQREKKAEEKGKETIILRGKPSE
jgi:K+-sensing histidine kinase KdpD